ncbi:MAG: nucleotide pyrophosphohydrolase [Nitrososphaerota archaeon]|jgi:NTP pyrophosphatase (non-canonical NTP hydrolase)|nr:nucleotide pyrophosphohydrolase [Nitrososphaerota archaeon]
MRHLDDTQTRIAELKEMARQFSVERDWDQFHNAKDLAIGIVTEASELLEMFRFKSDGEVDRMFKDNLQSKSIRDELADIVYFTVRLAQRYDIDISSSLEEKIRESARKYPIEKAKGSNKKYTEFAP